MLQLRREDLGLGRSGLGPSLPTGARGIETLHGRHDLTASHSVALFHVNSRYSAWNPGAYLMSLLGFDHEVAICPITQDRHKEHGEYGNAKHAVARSKAKSAVASLRAKESRSEGAERAQPRTENEKR